MKAFQNVRVYADGMGLCRTDVLFSTHILGIGGGIGDAEVISLPEDAIVLPGFIDEHIHGAGGADAMDASEEALSTIAQTVAQEGTTGFLATTMTQSRENILAAMRAVRAYRGGEHTGARLLGVHLEGPFISAAHKGAQPLEYVATPSVEMFEAYRQASGDCIRIVTLAPEEEGAEALIAHLHANGIVASVGHTGAKHDDIVRAMHAGATHVTHTYNAQSALHHREIGTVGCALLYDDLCCELITDGIHVSVPAMKLLAKNKPAGKLLLITDAMRAKGLHDGVSELGGQTVIVRGGEARLADGTLAGSVLRMNRAVENLVKKVGMDLCAAVDCATRYPARELGIEREAGSIAVGKRADFAVLNADFDVLMTVCGGEIAYCR